MKIVHLNTHSYGGAAVVARRIHLAALAAGHDSRFVTQYGLRGDPTANYSALRDARVLYALRAQASRPQLNRVARFVQRRLQHRNLVNRPGGFEVFSPVNTTDRFADCTDPYDPGIIHLHWIAGFVDHFRFFERNRERKFVWTLHDMNPFTGGCHHADGCTQFTAGCAHCPQLAGTVDTGYARTVLAAKTEMLSLLRDEQLVIAVPSKWLLDLSQRSPLTARFRHVLIPNPSLSAPPPTENLDDTKRALGLSHDRKILLFVSDNLRNPRKGIDLLFEAVEMMPDRDRVQLVGIGHRADAPRTLAVRFTGRITDERELGAYIACADALVSPSIMENSPLTVIEALTCGTPAVAFDVGGVSELISSGCGAVVAERSAAALAAALQKVLFGTSFDRAAIRRNVVRHEPAAVLQAYQSVYADLMAA